MLVLTGCAQEPDTPARSTQRAPGASDPATPTASTSASQSPSASPSASQGPQIVPAAFCDKVDEAAVIALLGTPLERKDATKPGDPINRPGGAPPQKARNYACAYLGQADVERSASGSTSLSNQVVFSVRGTPATQADYDERVAEFKDPSTCTEQRELDAAALGATAFALTCVDSKGSQAVFTVTLRGEGLFVCTAERSPEKMDAARQQQVVKLCADTADAISTS